MSRKSRKTNTIHEETLENEYANLFDKVLKLDPMQTELKGVHREKLGTANKALQTRREQSVGELLIGQWLENMINKFSFDTSIPDYHLTLRLARTSRAVRKDIAKLLFKRFQYFVAKQSVADCKLLFEFAVEIQHDPLCIKMIQENDHMSHFLRRELAFLLEIVSVNFFAYMYMHYDLLELIGVTEYTKLLAQLEDSPANRKKMHIFFDMVEKHTNHSHSPNWLTNEFTHEGGNMFILLTYQPFLRLAMFEEVFNHYSESVDYLKTLLQSQDFNVTPLVQMIVSVRSRAFFDTRALIFVMGLSDLNQIIFSRMANLTAVHWLVRQHHQIEKYADYKMVLDFLISTEAQEIHYAPARCDLGWRGQLTALEYARLELEDTDAGEHPFLEGIRDWLELGQV